MGNPYAPRRQGLQVDYAAMQRAADQARADEAAAQEQAAENARESHRVVDPITAVLQRIAALEERIAVLEAERVAPAALAAA